MGDLTHNLVEETLRGRATEGGKIWKTLLSGSISPRCRSFPSCSRTKSQLQYLLTLVSFLQNKSPHGGI